VVDVQHRALRALEQDRRSRLPRGVQHVARVPDEGGEASGELLEAVGDGRRIRHGFAGRLDLRPPARQVALHLRLERVGIAEVDGA
jgi:hypothetical protein